MFLIKQYREKAKLTQKQVAKETNVTVEYISYLENGQRTPSLQMLDKIATALNTTVKDLIQDEENKREEVK